MPLVEIKDFNALIDNKSFFDQPVKNKQEECEKLIEMSRNGDYTTGKFRLFVSSKTLYTHWYRFINTKKNMSIPQQINFTGNLREDDGMKMFSIAEKWQKLF